MEDIREFQEIVAMIDDIRDIREINRQERNPKVYLSHVNPFDKYNENEFKKIYRYVFIIRVYCTNILYT